MAKSPENMKWSVWFLRTEIGCFAKNRTTLAVFGKISSNGINFIITKYTKIDKNTRTLVVYHGKIGYL